MNVKYSILIMVSCIFLFSCTLKTVKKVSYGEKQYIQAENSDAEFVVEVKYQVPGVVKDNDKFYFKTTQSKTIEYSDGTIEGRRIGGGRRIAGKYRDGKTGWCNSSSIASANMENLKINLSVRWGGRSSGEIEKKLNIPWNELPKTINDESNNLTIEVSRKDLTK